MAYEEDTLREKVSEHAVQLSILSSNMTDIKDALRTNSESLVKISEAMVNQGIILEKLANIEKADKESKNRIHKLIEKHEEKQEELCKRIEINEIRISHNVKDVERLSRHSTELDPVRIMARYPKLALLVIVSAYTFTIKEFRDYFMGLMG